MMSKNFPLSRAITHWLNTLLSAALIALCLIFFHPLNGCANAQDTHPLGMSLLFTNKASYSIGVHRFAPGGLTGPVPGALGVGGSAQMSFMAGDSKPSVPQFVDIEWTVTTSEISEAQRQKDIRFKEYSTEWREETERIYAMSPMHKRRIDLTPILTPELLAQVRANRKNTQLKLKVVFTDDDVGITASAEVWR
jgi:hypothetical protein